MQTLDCGHTFHSHCIHDWSEQSALCPICRRRIETVKALFANEIVFNPVFECGIRIQCIDGLVRIIGVHGQALKLDIHVGDIITGIGKERFSPENISEVIAYVQQQRKKDAFTQIYIHPRTVLWASGISCRPERVLAFNDCIIDSKKKRKSILKRPVEISKYLLIS